MSFYLFMETSMPRRPSAGIAHIPTPHGIVAVRTLFAVKQETYIAVLAGPHAALRACLPEWRPRTPDSRQTQISPPRSVATPAEAMAWIAQLVPRWTTAARGGEAATAPAFITISDSLAAAERTLRATVRASTLGAYRKQWRRIARHLPTSTLLIACTRERIQALINALVADGLATTTVRAAVTALHRALVPAIDAGLVPVLAFQRLALPRLVVQPKLVLARPERDRMLQLAAHRGRDLHLVCALGLLAGLRRSEILALTWADVDLDRAVLAVRSGARFTTKSGRNRIVPIRRVLRDLLAANRKETVTPTTFVVAPDRPARRGWRWDFSKSFHALVREAGVPALTVHGMRRAFATLAVQGGVSIWKVKGWLGHATVQVTERYTADLATFDADIELAG